MVKSYANIEKMLLATKGMKKVFNELGEMPLNLAGKNRKKV